MISYHVVFNEEDYFSYAALILHHDDDCHGRWQSCCSYFLSLSSSERPMNVKKRTHKHAGTEQLPDTITFLDNMV